MTSTSLGPVVVLELETQERTRVVHLAYTAGEWKAEELGQLGADLTGLPVDRVAPDQDEVEGPSSPERRRQCARCGEGVRAGKRRVAQVQAALRAPGNPLAQYVLRARRPEGDDGARAPGVAGEDHPLGHRTATVGVHLDGHAVADEPPFLEEERFGHWHLFDQRRDAERVPSGSRHAIAPGGRACSDSGQGRSMPVTLLGRRLPPGTGAPQQPTAPPSGLRGSEAPTRRSESSAPRAASMIWAQPTATGSKGLMACTR